MVRTAHPDVRIELRSDPRYVCVARHAIQSMGQVLDLGEKSCAELALAITEAVSNVIRHGYQGKPDRPIWLSARPVECGGRHGLEVVIEDECPDVDLARIRSRSLDDIRPGGLGVHIIQRIMDEVEYEHRESGNGVRLRIRKYANGTVSNAGTSGNTSAPAQKEPAL